MHVNYYNRLLSAKNLIRYICAIELCNLKFKNMELKKFKWKAGKFL